ncbi:uncharacterized protein BXZ73DRAFT_85805 [Epithele typhae]|uniref:uncharacterized protein n=1 Tax=Epithele typhae TaxID=378194 RepID=UPI002008AA23|nr:uncharacterized protein BXZ73DRAFT_85805 [Epithele typhae]KAH9897616.1 hypothetical protein BXZ73DRAFT_85805 [Epithele typhae]
MKTIFYSPWEANTGLIQQGMLVPVVARPTAYIAPYCTVRFGNAFATFPWVVRARNTRFYPHSYDPGERSERITETYGAVGRNVRSGTCYYRNQHPLLYQPGIGFPGAAGSTLPELVRPLPTGYTTGARTSSYGRYRRQHDGVVPPLPTATEGEGGLRPPRAHRVPLEPSTSTSRSLSPRYLAPGRPKAPGAGLTETGKPKQVFHVPMHTHAAHQLHALDHNLRRPVLGRNVRDTPPPAAQYNGLCCTPAMNRRTEWNGARSRAELLGRAPDVIVKGAAAFVARVCRRAEVSAQRDAHRAEPTTAPQQWGGREEGDDAPEEAPEGDVHSARRRVTRMWVMRREQRRAMQVVGSAEMGKAEVGNTKEEAAKEEKGDAGGGGGGGGRHGGLAGGGLGGGEGLEGGGRHGRRRSMQWAQRPRGRPAG